MIIFNDVFIFAEIPLLPNTFLVDENENFIITDDESAWRDVQLIYDIINKTESYGYTELIPDESVLRIFLSGIIQFETFKLVVRLIGNLQPVASRPFAIEQIIDGNYGRRMVFDEERESEANALNHLMTLKNDMVKTVRALSDEGGELSLAVKRLSRALDGLLSSPSVTRRLSTKSIFDAIEEMKESIGYQ